jgi:tetratricopeptide (TPR) repeat protein
LLPEAAKETDRTCQLADRAVLLGKEHSDRIWFLFCKGLADYRRGSFPAAIERLDALLAQTAPIPQLTLSCHLVLAMAQHRQGDEKAAREHLERAVKLLDQYLPDLPFFPKRWNGYNHDRLIAWLLHREAQALIEGKKVESQK